MHIEGYNVIRHTRKFDAMRRFYHDQLGLPVVEEWDEPGNRGVVLSWSGSATIEILSLGDLAQPDTAPVNVELGIHVSDVEAEYVRLRSAGVTMARGLETAPWGHRSFGIDDPDGLRIWIVQDVRSD